MLIDTHCHIVEKQFDKDRESVIQRCFDNGVKLINCSTDLTSSNASLDLISKYKKKGVYTAIGFDPQETETQQYDQVAFEKLLQEKQQDIVAVGEIGLEYFKQNNFTQQREVFKDQVMLAKKYALPVIIHCRDFDDDRNNAYDDVCRVLDEVDSPYKGVVHCFSGTVKQALALTQRGYYLGFNGIITFNKPGATHEVLKSIDTQYILLETDAPYLAPVPFRGNRNEPLYVQQVAEKLSEILKLSLSDAQELTNQNAQRLFNL